MKRLLGLGYILLLFCISFYVSCRKEKNHSNDETTPPVEQQNENHTILLHSKPLDTIRSYIQGMWQVKYIKRRGPYNDIINAIGGGNYWKFTSDDKIMMFTNLIWIDTAVNWGRGADIYNGDSTFILNTFDKGEEPLSYAVDSIFNDTLIIHENKKDAFIYYLVNKNEVDTGYSTILFNKALDTIRHYIQGKWKCHYSTNSFGISSYNNYYWTFTSSDRVERSSSGIVSVDTTINWPRFKQGIYAGRDSVFVMNFYDKSGFPYYYITNCIFNDTLIVNDNAFDGRIYYLTKF